MHKVALLCYDVYFHLSTVINLVEDTNTQLPIQKQRDICHKSSNRITRNLVFLTGPNTSLPITFILFDGMHFVIIMPCFVNLCHKQMFQFYLGTCFNF